MYTMALLWCLICAILCFTVLGNANSNKISSHLTRPSSIRSRKGVKENMRSKKNLASLSVAETVVASNSSPTISLKTMPFKTKKLEFLSIFLPWLYFLCTSMNIATLPRYINSVMSPGGDDKVSQLGIKVYGNLQGFDAFFTFLSVNLVGCLSDIFGRKPFMFMSSLGLGTSYFIQSFAKRPIHFYLASSIDGLTSCMLSQSQSFITDLTGEETNLGIALSRFQGLAIGMAFLIGIPLGQVLSKYFGKVMPLRASVAICVLNCILILWLLPRHLTSASHHEASLPIADNKPKPSTAEKLKRLPWHQANPMGAAWILTKSRTLLISSLAYFFIQLAQCGVQATWINYLGHKFQMSSSQAGSTLLLVGIMMAVIPPYAM